MDLEKEILDIKEETKILKEKVRLLECRSMGVDPYEPHSAYDLSKR